MRTPWHDLWGCGEGPCARLAPPTRLLVAGAVFAACLIAPTTGATGVLFLVGISTAWLLACRPPLAVLRRALGLALTFWLPLWLLLPLLAQLPLAAAGGVAGGRYGAALALLAALLLRGLALLLVALSAVATLSPSALREAPLRLPLPRLAVAIVLQLVQQTASLVAETQRIAAALVVRGATSGGARRRWRVLGALPRVWLPRVIARAERVGDAMELRGFDRAALRSLRSQTLGRRDVTAGALALGLLAIASALRLGAP